MRQPAAGPELPGVRVITDIAYAPPQPTVSQAHLIDLYVPTGVERPLPVVIWSDGSGWRAENGRGGAELVTAHLNPRGFAVAGAGKGMGQWIYAVAYWGGRG